MSTSLRADTHIRTTCPYCGVGCQMNLHVKDNRIYRVEAPFDSAPNYGNLCVKGRFGLDFATHPRRLKTPLIRDGERGNFREATWDEALTFITEKLSRIVQEHGGDSVATYACAKATNEDNYIFQKWVRAVMKTNNVDHCARLCHAGSVTGLQLAIGSSAMSNSIAEMENLDTFIVTGSNTTETHPVISLFLKKAVRKNGAKLIVIDPRQIELTDFATLWLRQKPGTDVAVYQAMANVVVTEKLYNREFIEQRTEGFDEYIESLEHCTPEWGEEITGIPADDIRQAARMYATADRAAFYWGMGISQSVHGTDNTLSITNLALMCGHAGKPGTGLNPLRGQNNVQGCSDSGGLPNVYTAYQSVSDPDIKQKFETAWHTSNLSDEPGLTVTEMVDGALTGRIKAMVVMGENPMMSEPNLSHAQHAIEALDLLVCIDIFMNETGEMADVILPSASFAEKDGTFTNSDRRVQRVRQALPSVGDSLPDWQIICQLAQRMEAQLGIETSAGFDYQDAEAIWEEMRQVTPPFYGITYERIEREGGVHWPCPSLDHPGTPYLFEDEFPRGRGKFWELEFGSDSEHPDDAYPYHLTTGRVLFHWHGGTMTRRSKLDEAFPVPIIEMHPDDARNLQVISGDWVEITSRRGQVACQVMVTGRSPVGTVFLPFHFVEAAANILTLDKIDPRAKIPDFKMAAVNLKKVDAPSSAIALDEQGAIKNPTRFVH